MKVTICLSLFYIFLGGIAQAQYDPLLSSNMSKGHISKAPAYNSINRMKAEISDLLKENERLDSEHQRLTAELEMLQAEAYQNQQQIKKMKLEAWEQIDQQRTYSNELIGLENDVGALENERLLIESKNSFMSGRLIDLEQNQGLRQLQLAEMEIERKELELNFKLKQFDHEQAVAENLEEVRQIKEDYQINLEIEKELVRKIEKVEEEGRENPKVIQRIKDENKKLENKIQDLEAKHDRKVKENNFLKNKKFYVQKFLEHEYWKVDTERDRLEETVKVLREEYGDLNKKVKMSLLNKNKKKRLINDVLIKDQENQKLREMIAQLQKDIDTDSN